MKRKDNLIAEHVTERSRAKLPPDPEGQNDKRAAWAQAAIDVFRTITGTDLEDSLGDLLCDLMHWADRNDFDFEAAMDRARYHYEAETGDPETVIDKALEAFWQIVVEHYPAAKSGDLSPLATLQLSEAASTAIEEWVENNVPGRSRL